MAGTLGWATSGGSQPALHAKGNLLLHQYFPHEGILGTIFTGRLIAETQVGPYRAVIPTLSGRAWIAGFANYTAHGHNLRSYQEEEERIRNKRK